MGRVVESKNKTRGDRTNNGATIFLMDDTTRTPLQRFNAALDELCEASCVVYQHVRIGRCPGCEQCVRLVDEYNARIATYNAAERELLSP